MSLFIPSRRLLLAPKPRPVPLQVGAPIVWCKATSVKLLDGLGVPIWLDQGGMGNHFIQTTAGQQPLLKLNVVNGKPVVRFDGSNDVLVTASLNPGVPIAQPTTIIIVARVAATAAAQVFYDSLSTREFAFKNNGGTGDFLYGAPTTITGETPHTWGSFEIYTCIFNGASSASYINGVAKGTGDTGTQGLTRIMLGDNGNPGTAPIDGDVPEFIAYRGALSLGAMKVLHRYLGREYGIVVAA